LLGINETKKFRIITFLENEFTCMIKTYKLFDYVAMKKSVIAPRLEGLQDYFYGS